MNYKGYHASVVFEEDSDVFVGRLVGISDIVVFEAETVDGLKSAFHEAVDDYLQHCERIGKEPKKHYSGKLMLRIDPKVHAELEIATKLSTAKSMSEFAETVLHEEAQKYLSSASG